MFSVRTTQIGHCKGKLTYENMWIIPSFPIKLYYAQAADHIQTTSSSGLPLLWTTELLKIPCKCYVVSLLADGCFLVHFCFTTVPGLISNEANFNIYRAYINAHWCLQQFLTVNRLLRSKGVLDNCYVFQPFHFIKEKLRHQLLSLVMGKYMPKQNLIRQLNSLIKEK